MSELGSQKDYYQILGAQEDDSLRDLERSYKRMAARRHPDKGGTEEDMKSLNEAYRILRNADSRRRYDEQRVKIQPAQFVPHSSPPAQDIGLYGHGLSALLCLLVGLFLLFLVRFQWIWFLWPLAILAVFVILFGVLMARSAMRAMNDALPVSNRFRRYTRIQEALFWSAVAGGGYGVYLLLTSV
ncbi:MAG TPA: J domain-containing protein [Pyrinomonadaceae bacterium]|nr:J domain-containing protein [Pyrinomonadaceae bacterium]